MFYTMQNVDYKNLSCNVHCSVCEKWGGFSRPTSDGPGICMKMKEKCRYKLRFVVMISRI